MAAFKPPCATSEKEKCVSGFGRLRARTHLPTYHNCEEYADDGHANYGGPIGYTNDRRQRHAGRVDGYAEIADLPNNIRGRGEAAYGATLESETI